MRAADVAKFSVHVVRPQLGSDYVVYSKKDLLRMRGNFVQLITFTSTKSGWLRVIPTLYVVGADLGDHDRPNQTVSLEVLNPQHWQFPPDTALNNDLAVRLIEQIEKESAVSFVERLSDDEKISDGFQPFIDRQSHWAAFLCRAYFNICRGAPSGREDLALARRIFLKKSRYGSGKVPLEYERILLGRLDTLDIRMDGHDCLPICRAESEEQCRRLSLPSIEWPSNWPQTVAPWPRSETLRWIERLLRRE